MLNNLSGMCVMAGFAVVAASAATGDESTCLSRLSVTNQNVDHPGGSLATMCADEPWQTQTNLASVDSHNHTVRVFGDVVYVVDRSTGTISSFASATARELDQYDLGIDAEPHDIAVIDSSVAYVTRHNAASLLRIDLATGDMTDVADLSIFTPPDQLPGMSMMARDGDRLFIQIQESSVLAVFDVVTESLIDVDPGSPGVQPVQLQGLLPKFKMQIDPALRRLYVSAAGIIWVDNATQSADSLGIEIIDLDTLQSDGFAITLADTPFFLSMGAFIMVSDDQGYLVGHTQVIPSSHLIHFTISEGPSDLMALDALNWITRSLAFDSVTGLVFFPDGNVTMPGIHVIDAKTGQLLSGRPVNVGGQPTDVALVQPLPWDLNGDGVVNVLDLLLVLENWGRCEGIMDCPADFNDDGIVNVLDLLILLENWS